MANSFIGNPIIVGNPTPHRQKWGVKWSPTSGGDWSAHYTGTSISQMLALAGSNAYLGLNCDLSFANNVAELTISSTDPAQAGYATVFSSITDKWEVGVDQEKPELFENPNFLSLFAVLDASYFAAFGIYVSHQFFQFVKQFSENGNPTWGKFVTAMQTQNLVQQDGTDIPPTGAYQGSMYESMKALATPLWGGVSAGLTLKFFVEEYFRGRTNFAHGKYTLKHTTIAPQTYQGNVTDFNVEKIYSMAQLLTEVQNSALWILPLPGYLVYKLLNYPVPVNMPPLYQWGALKMRANAVVAAKGRIEISQEYLIDACAVPTYGTIS